MANATRWNSQVTMLKSLLKVPPHILSTLQENSGIKLTAYEMTIITELFEIIEPSKFVTSQIHLQHGDYMCMWTESQFSHPQREVYLQTTFNTADISREKTVAV